MHWLIIIHPTKRTKPLCVCACLKEQICWILLNFLWRNKSSRIFMRMSGRAKFIARDTPSKHALAALSLLAELLPHRYCTSSEYPFITNTWQKIHSRSGSPSQFIKSEKGHVHAFLKLLTGIQRIGRTLDVYVRIYMQLCKMEPNAQSPHDLHYINPHYFVYPSFI